MTGKTTSISTTPLHRIVAFALALRPDGLAKVLLTLACVGTAQATSASQQQLAFDDFSTYQGLGLGPSFSGGLDSDDWRITGLSEGDTVFGSNVSGGDFGRGHSTGGVGSGGLYAFEIDGDVALGVQATTADFTPGAFTRRVRHSEAQALNGFELGYELLVRNEGDRSTQWLLDWSLDGGQSWVSLTDGAMSTPQGRDGTISWQSTLFNLTVDTRSSGTPWQPESDLLLRWSAQDLAGSGGRDEVALDDIRVLAPLQPSPVPLPASAWLLLCAIGSTLAIRRPSTGIAGLRG